jgi:hypothetical protein
MIGLPVLSSIGLFIIASRREKQSRAKKVSVSAGEAIRGPDARLAPLQLSDQGFGGGGGGGAPGGGGGALGC